MTNIERIVMEIQGELVIQNKRIDDLQEEIRLLRLQIDRQKPVVLPPNTTRIGYRTFNRDRVVEVYKQYKSSKNEKHS